MFILWYIFISECGCYQVGSVPGTTCSQNGTCTCLSNEGYTGEKCKMCMEGYYDISPNSDHPICMGEFS